MDSLQVGSLVASKILAKDQKNIVVFRSRYRSFTKILKRVKTGTDEAGHGQYEVVEANFRGGMLTVPNTPENEEKIALLRSGICSDYTEVDLVTEKSQVEEANKEITRLKARVKELERVAVDPDKPDVKVRKPRKESVPA